MFSWEKLDKRYRVCMYVHVQRDIWLLSRLSSLGSAYEVIFREEAHPLFTKKIKERMRANIIFSLYIQRNIIINYNK